VTKQAEEIQQTTTGYHPPSLLLDKAGRRMRPSPLDNADNKKKGEKEIKIK
jgi:hypothetical protein